MNEKDKLQQTAINVYGLANIDCTMENVTFQTMVQSAGEQPSQAKEEAATAAAATATARDEELCHFIRPSVNDEQAWIYHDEIKRLVKRQGLQEICRYLNEMEKDNKLYLPQSSTVAYKELLRMGMTEKEGFSENYFRKFYRK